MTTQTNHEAIVNQSVEIIVANFDPKDKAPASLIATSHGMQKTVLLFSDKTDAANHFKVMQDDPEVEAEMDGHGYIIMLDASKNLDGNLNADQREQHKHLIHEVTAIALAQVHEVECLGWAEIYGKAASLWFAEPF